MNLIGWLIYLLASIAYGERAPWDQGGVDLSRRIVFKEKGAMRVNDNQHFVVSENLFDISLASAKNVDSLFQQNGSLEDGIRRQSEIFMLRTALELPTTNISRPLGPVFRGSFGAPTPPPMASHAGCIPALEVVPIAMEQDATLYFFPTCTRIERCGGCCSHHLLTCQPTEVEEVELSVLRIDHLGGEDAMTVVNMTRHVGCKCGCRIQESDCTVSQVYREDRCGCVCANKQVCQPTMYWDANICECRCKNADVEYCSTGQFFNNSTCECDKLQQINSSTSRPPYRGPSRGRRRMGVPRGAVKKGGTKSIVLDNRDSR